MSSRTSSSPASLHSHPTSTSVTTNSVPCCFPPATSVSSSSNIITTSPSNTNNPHCSFPHNANQQQQKAASPVTQQQQQQQFTIRTAAPFQQQPANTSYPTMSANDSSSSSSPAEAFSRLCLGGEIIQVPTAIVQQEWLFRAVVTKDAYRSLSVEAQTYLKRFLPKYDGATEKEDEEKILDSVFTNDPNFYFGNPLGKIYSKLRCGWFNPERPGDQVQLRDNRRVLYDHYIRYYHISLLKKLLISRRKLLEQFATLGGNEEPTCSAPDSALIRKRNTTTRLKARAEYRTRLMLDDVKRRVDDTTQSSDEEFSDAVNLPPSKLPLTAAGRSTLYSPNFVDLDLHQPIYMNDVKDMLKEYQRLRELEPDSPSLDISEINADEVYERAGLPCLSDKNLPAEISEAMKQPYRPPK